MLNVLGMKTLRYSPRSDAGMLVIGAQASVLTAKIEACEARIEAGYAKLRRGDASGEADANAAFAEQEQARAALRDLEATLCEVVAVPPSSKAGPRVRGFGRKVTA